MFELVQLFGHDMEDKLLFAGKSLLQDPCVAADLQADVVFAGEAVDGADHAVPGDGPVVAAHEGAVLQHLPLALQIVIDVIFFVRGVDVVDICLKIVMAVPESDDGAGCWDGDDLILHAFVADVGEELVVEGGIAVLEIFVDVPAGAAGAGDVVEPA